MTDSFAIVCGSDSCHLKDISVDYDNTLILFELEVTICDGREDGADLFAHTAFVYVVIFE